MGHKLPGDESHQQHPRNEGKIAWLWTTEGMALQSQSSGSWYTGPIINLCNRFGDICYCSSQLSPEMEAEMAKTATSTHYTTGYLSTLSNFHPNRPEKALKQLTDFRSNWYRFRILKGVTDDAI